MTGNWKIISFLFLEDIFFLPFFFFFLGLHPWHMEVLRLGVEQELQLPAYTTATATGDPSHVCDLHRSSQQCRIPDPLSRARERTRILMDTSRICFLCIARGTSRRYFQLKNRTTQPSFKSLNQSVHTD